MQDKTIFYGNIIISGEVGVNETFPTKKRTGLKWNAQNDVTEVVIPLHIIVHTKTKVLFPIMLTNLLEVCV